jgi:hypothetical protein
MQNYDCQLAFSFRTTTVLSFIEGQIISQNEIIKIQDHGSFM